MQAPSKPSKEGMYHPIQSLEPPKKHRNHSIPASKTRKPNSVSRRGEEPAHTGSGLVREEHADPGRAPQPEFLLSATHRMTKLGGEGP